MSGSLSPPLDLDLPYKPPTQRPRPPTYDKRDPKVVEEHVTKVVQVVAALDGIAEFTRSNVEAAIGAPLGPPVKQPGGALEYSANVTQGPFHRIVLRQSGSKQGAPESTIWVDVRQGVDLKKTDFPAGYLGSSVSFTPDNGDGGTFTYTKEGRGRRTVYAFNTATARFGGVIFYRGHGRTAP